MTTIDRDPKGDMLAYHNSETLKEKTLAEVLAHQKADEIVQGRYWEDGKGCAVGCLTHDPSGGHAKYPKLWGIPEPLAYLEDTLFESLSVEDSKGWPARFLSAIPVGADLARCWDKWQAWCLRDLMAIAGENAHVVEVMAVLFERAGAGDEPSDTEWSEAAGDARDAGAARAAWAARDARDARAARAAGATRALGPLGPGWGAGAGSGRWGCGGAAWGRLGRWGRSGRLGTLGPLETLGPLGPLLASSGLRVPVTPSLRYWRSREH